MYTKTNWKDRVVEKPLTFSMTTNPDGTITLTPAEGQIVEPGTPIHALNLNKIEQGIEEALRKDGGKMTGKFTLADIDVALEFENAEGGFFLDRFGNFKAKPTVSSLANWALLDKDNNRVLTVRYGEGREKNVIVHHNLVVESSSNGAGGFWGNQVRAASIDMGYADSSFVNLYLRPKATGEARVTSTGTTNDYRPIAASEFKNASSERYKENIYKVERSATELINQATIYEYNLKNDEEKKQKFGLIVERETPEQVKSGEGVDTYAMVSLAWKAIQELTEQNQQLRSELNELKSNTN